MDVVSGAFAVLSLSVQLAQTVKKANNFLKDIQKAPDELARLVETLDQLNLILIQVNHLIEQQNNIEGIPSSIDAIQNALRSCEKITQKLKLFVDKLEACFHRQGRVRNVWASLKSVVKKDDIAELRGQIHENITILNTAVLMNNAVLMNTHYLQLHQLQITTTHHQQKMLMLPDSASSTDVTTIDNDFATNSPFTHRQNRLVETKENTVFAYWGAWGYIVVRKKVKFLRTQRSGREQASSQEMTVLFQPPFINKVFELRPRSLGYFPVLPSEAEVFKWARWGHIQDFKEALSQREISPFVRDEWGRTLLHFSVNSRNTDFCLLLIQLGVDVDHRDFHGDKALHTLYLRGERAKSSGGDIARALASAQDDITAEEVSIILRSNWPIEVVDFLLFTYADPDQIKRGIGTDCPPLDLALRQYGKGRKEWGILVRKLLRQGADIHAGRPFSGLANPSISEHLTPLDELFYWSRDPFDGLDARGWLTMLEEEGYDVGAYIEEEIALHAGQNMLTYHYFTSAVQETTRQLIFQGGESPNVWWDWWINPSSAASLVRTEFRHMNIYHWDSWLNPDRWKEVWPFVYPYTSEAQESFIRLISAEERYCQDWV